MDIPIPKKKKFYKKWWFWLFFIIVVFVALIGIAVLGYQQKSRLKSLSYLKEAAEVKRRDIEKTISTSGTIVPDAIIDLSFSAPAVIQEIKFTPGDLVLKDEVIIKGENGELKAPFDGRILDITAIVGDVTRPGIPLVKYGYRTSHIEFLASDAEVLQLKKDQQVEITIPALNNNKDFFTGRITSVGVQKETGQIFAASSGNGTSGYKIKIFPDNIPANVLEVSGLSVDLKIIVDKRLGVLSLETSAIQSEDNGERQSFVYELPVLDKKFVLEDKKIEDISSLLSKKDLVTGFSGDSYTEIISGLSEGEKILLFIPRNSQKKSFF